MSPPPGPVFFPSVSALLLSERPFCRHPCQAFSCPSVRPRWVPTSEERPQSPSMACGPCVVWAWSPTQTPPIPLFAHWGALPCQCLPPSPVLPSAGYWYAGSSSGLSDDAGPAHVAPLGKTFPSNLVQSTHPGRVPTPAPALSPPLISSQLMPSELNLVLWKWLCVLSRFSRVRLFAAPWTVTLQAPLSMGLLQARILEWVVKPSSRGSSQPGDQTCAFYVSCTGRQVLYHWCHLGLPAVYTPSIMQRTPS